MTRSPALPKLSLVKSPRIAHLDEQKHRRVPIYSVDFHPTRPIFATGGIDTHIRLWDASTLEMQSKLSLHNGAVLCVRFRPVGVATGAVSSWLASSSDGDNAIVIWEPAPAGTTIYNGGLAFGSASGSSQGGPAEIIKEVWRCRKRLAGHQSDVVALAWSPDGQFLASTGLDGNIIIWDGETFDVVKKLSAVHSDFVKGLAFDPAGRFLASQADDRSILIWNTFDWSLITKIEDRLEKSVGQTFFKRLDWAPDGSHLAAVEACDVSQLVSTLSLINRERWDEDACLVGHRLGVQVAAYNPCMFREQPPSTSKNEMLNDDVDDDDDDVFSVVALGSQDGSLSLWTSKHARARFVVTNLFDGPIYDLRWSADGSMLLACSADGCVAVLSIGKCVPGKGELKQWAPQAATSLGFPLTREQLEERLMKYGFEKGTKRKAADAVEFPEFAGAVLGGDGDKKAPGADVSMDVDRSPASSQQPPTAAAPANVFQPPMSTTPPARNTLIPSGHALLMEQKVTTTRDGKRRVQPITVSSPSANTSLAFGFGAAASMQPSKPQRPVVSDLPVQLPVPPLKTHLSLEHLGPHKFRLSVDQPNLRGLTKVSLEGPTEGHAWTDYVPQPVMHLVASPQVTSLAAVLLDGAVVVWSAGGRRKLPTLITDSAASKVCLTETHLAVLTRRGGVWLWDLGDGRCLLHQVSAASVLVKTISDIEQHRRKFKQPGSDNKEASAPVKMQLRAVSAFEVSKDGVLTLTVDNHGRFTFDQQTKSWAKLESKQQFDRLCDFYHHFHGDEDERPKPLNEQALRTFLHDTNGSALTTSTAISTDMRQRVTLAQLEEQLALALHTAQPEHYRRILKKYAQRLADMGELAVSRVNEVCAELTRTQPPDLLGIPRVALLRDIFPILSRSTKLHRTLHAYHHFIDDSKRPRTVFGGGKK